MLLALHSNQIKAARGEITRVDGKVDSLDKALRAELREVDDRHARNIESNSSRIHMLELEKAEIRDEINAMKPRISSLEEDSKLLQDTVTSHGERYCSSMLQSYCLVSIFEREGTRLHRLTTTEESLADTSTRLKTLEKTIEEADLAGIKLKLDATGS